MGVEPGYGTQSGGDITEGWCVPQGVTLEVHTPVVEPQAVIAPDKPWERNHVSGYSTFLEEGGAYRCWYGTGNHTVLRRIGRRNQLAQAESGSGGGGRSRENNAVIISGLEKNPFDEAGVPHGSNVFVDPVAPDSERYKMVSCFWSDTERKILGAVSPDGLQWTALPQPLMDHQHADTQKWPPTTTRWSSTSSIPVRPAVACSVAGSTGLRQRLPALSALSSSSGKQSTRST